MPYTSYFHQPYSLVSLTKVRKPILLALSTAGLILLQACSPPDINISNQTIDQNNAVDSAGFTAATEHTITANRALIKTLPFTDTQDFTDAKRGLIASLPSLKLTSENGDIIWEQAAYDFIQGDAPATVNPSLWRQASLNNIQGLFEVTKDVYQIRGFDLANMTVIAGKTGWIIVDPLTTAETAKAALEFVNEQLGKRPLAAIIFTHSHMDHFGGALGLLEGNNDELANIDIVAPAGFMHEATSENVMAGTAMSRRSMYMYGKRLPRSARGHIDSGLGKEPAFGTFSILTPTITVAETGEKLSLDGVDFEFQIVSGSEAPAEFTFYLPQMNAYCGAELVSKTMHNLYTLRGAKVRDALGWSSAIDQALTQQKKANVYFGSHHWPIWGQENIADFLEKQRDTYKYIHDQSVRMLNAGLTPNEIAEQITMPPALASTFATRGYYGTAKHNAKAVYQAYLGWYDANPANLNPLPKAQSANKYIDLMGGSDAVYQHAANAFAKGEYRWVAELLDRLVFTNKSDDKVKALLAKTYDQLGYQAESAPWRDVYLTAAYELRHGEPETGIDLVAMKQILLRSPIENFLQSMAGRIIGPDAFGKEYVVNINFTDLDENYVLTLKNAVLHHKKLPRDRDASVTLNITHTLFIDLVIGSAGVTDVLFSDDLELEGSKFDLVDFLSLFDKPKGVFAIVTP